MFIRKTATRNKATNESYFTYRLVTSERAGKQVRQITLLNLGRHFALPQVDWPRASTRCSPARVACSPRPKPSKRYRNAMPRA